MRRIRAASAFQSRYVSGVLLTGLPDVPVAALKRGPLQGREELWQWAYLPLAAAAALRCISPTTAVVAYLVLGAYALLGPGHTLRALFLCWLFTTLTTAFPLPVGSGALRFIPVLCGAATVLVRGRELQGFLGSAFVRVTIAFAAFVALSIVFVSPVPALSSAKLVSWMVAVFAVFGAWSLVSARQREQLGNELLIGLSLVLISGLALIKSDVGYVLNKVGLQGILNQPQAFGTTIGLLFSWCLARILTETPPRLYSIVLLLAGAVAIYASKARTGGYAALLSIPVAVVFLLLFGGQRLRDLIPGVWTRRFWLLVVLLAVAMIAMWPMAKAAIEQFFQKAEFYQNVGLLNSYYQSRAILIDPMLANIQAHPIWGIGYGIPSNLEKVRIVFDPIFHLIPVGAPSEKGMLPLLVQEELGVGGVLLFILWTAVLFRDSMRGGLQPTALCAVVFLTNLAESSLLSAGGMGLLLLLVLGWARSAATSPYPSPHPPRGPSPP